MWALPDYDLLSTTEIAIESIIYLKSGFLLRTQTKQLATPCRNNQLLGHQWNRPKKSTAT
jgi:hypothetical protein